MNIDYDEISQSGNSQKDYNKIHIIKECSKQFNKEKQNLNQEKETNDETVQKSIEDNFKLKLDDDIYDNDDSVLQEGNNSITEQSLKYFESKSSELEDKNIEEKKDKNFLGKKIERNNEICFIPKAFLIYSQYPYFTTFYNICSILREFSETQTMDESNIICEDCKQKNKNEIAQHEMNFCNICKINLLLKN